MLLTYLQHIKKSSLLLSILFTCIFFFDVNTGGAWGPWTTESDECTIAAGEDESSYCGVGYYTRKRSCKFCGPKCSVDDASIQLLPCIQEICSKQC